MSASASAISSRSQAARSWSASRRKRPSASVRVPAPRLVHEQQREQPGRLALRREQRDQHPREVERPPGEVVAHERRPGRRGVPGRVEQVDHGERRVEPRRQLLGGRDRERDPRRGDLLLRARQPRRHRRLAHEEGLRDVGRRDAADEPERQRDLRLARRAPDGSRRRRAAAGRRGTAPDRRPRPRPRRRARRAAAASPRASGERRSRLSAVRFATVTSHAAGRSGTPSRGQVRSARS